MSIQSQIERIQLNRDIIRAKMVDAGQASLNDDFDTLTENLTVYPIDNSLSNMSENPVQNKVIKGELDKAYKTDDTAETVLADADYIPFYDTSAGGKRRTLWSNVMAKLADTFQKKLTAGELISIDSNNKISSTVPTFANAFSRGDIIDTTERIVGMFIGKPMYQKVIYGEQLRAEATITTVGDKTQYTVNYNIGASVDYAWVVNAFVKIPDTKSIQQLNFTRTKLDSSGNFELYDTNSFIVIGTDDYEGALKNKLRLTLMSNNSSYANVYPIIIFRYTKTTDTANTIKYGTGNDYSLDEQIVGTWIDGKPLYQKTVYAENVEESIDNNIHIRLGDSTIRIISTDGLVIWNDVGSSRPLVFYKKDADVLNNRIYSNVAYVPSTDSINLMINSPDNLVAGKDVIVTVKYTKTTD